MIRHAGRRWEILPGAEEIVRSRAEWGFAGLREEFADVLLKAKATRIVFPMETEWGKVSVKALTFDRFRVRLRSLYGRCRTRKEWENHLAARRCGLPTVVPLALGELRTFGVTLQAVILTQWRPAAFTVTEHRRRAPAAAEAPMPRLAADIARVTATAQSFGIYHNEIRPDNLLLEPADDALRLLLIDWKHAHIRRRTTARDLQNLLRTKELFERDLLFAPPVEAETRAFLSTYFEATADRPDRAALAAQLADACPDAAWLPAELGV